MSQLTILQFEKPEEVSPINHGLAQPSTRDCSSSGSIITDSVRDFRDRGDGQQYSTNAKGFTGRPLSLSQAKEFAWNTISNFPLGSQFTCYSLFHKVKTRFDRRNLAQALQILRKGGFVQAVGTKKEQRENGNSGYSTVWEVVKEVM